MNMADSKNEFHDESGLLKDHRRAQEFQEIQTKEVHSVNDLTESIINR